MSECLSSETLRDLLAGNLPDTLLLDVRTHLTNCTLCQSLLDNLSKDSGGG